MNTPTYYRFRYLPARYMYLLLWVLLTPFLFIPATIVFDPSTNAWIIVMALIGMAFLGGLIYCIVQMNRKKTKEEIRFTDSGFESALFGTIHYADVLSYKIGRGFSRLNFDKPAPSLHLYLGSGRKITYNFNIQRYEQELPDYMAFINRFVEGKAAFDQGRPLPAEAEAVTTTPESWHAAASGNPEEAYTTAKASLQAAENKQKNAKKLAVPLSLLVSLLLLIRACGPQLVKQFRHDPFETMRETIPASFAGHVTDLKKLIRQEGPVYLYTNDSAASAMLYPNIPGVSGALRQVPLLEMAETNEAIDSFVRHKDSLGFSTLLKLKDTAFIQSRLFYQDEAARGKKALLLSVFDSENEMPKAGRPLTNGKRWALSWQVNYTSPADVVDSITHAFPNLAMMTVLIREMKGYKLYVTASQNKGCSAAEFRQVITSLNGFLHKQKVDTTKFLFVSPENASQDNNP